MMDLQLTLSESELEVLEAAAGEPARRTIAGVAVPWGIVARVASGQLVRFEAGSVELEGVAVVRDHDATRPIGLVASSSSDELGHSVAVKVSQTLAGDETLALASDGVLGFSVGLSATQHEWDTTGDEPVLVVAEAAPRELSLLVNPAFGAESAVTQVAASVPIGEGNTMQNQEPAPLEPIAAADPGPVEVAPPALVVRSEPVPLTAGAFVVETILAQQGDADAIRILAALAAETTLTNPGVVPDQYVGSILGGLNTYRPIHQSVGHGQLPAAGNNLVRPNWTTLPQVQKYATENTEPPTGPVQIGNITIPKESWAHAIMASIALINRSDPGYAEAYFREAVQSFYGALEQDMGAELVAGTTAAPVPALTAANAISTAVAQAVTAQADANPIGAFAGVWPTFALAGMNVWGGLVGAATDAGLAFGSGQMTMDGPAGGISGITVRACPHIPTDDVIVGDQSAATLYEQTVLDLRALVVNTMSWEMGVYTDTAFNINKPLALGRATYDPAYTPPVAASARRGK